MRRNNRQAEFQRKVKPTSIKGAPKRLIPGYSVVSLVLGLLFIIAAVGISIIQPNLRAGLSSNTDGSFFTNSVAADNSSKTGQIQSDGLNNSAAEAPLPPKNANDKSDKSDTDSSNAQTNSDQAARPVCDRDGLNDQAAKYDSNMQQENYRHYSVLSDLRIRRWLDQFLHPRWYDDKIHDETELHQSVVNNLQTAFKQTADRLNCQVILPAINN